MPNKLNLIGQKYGRLTVISEAEPHITASGTRQTQWNCVCECGNKVIIKTANLRSGNTQSCGCFCKENIASQAKQRTIDLTGKRFGSLIVVCEDKTRNTPKKHWICKCDCGKITSVSGNNIRQGVTTSCGCRRSAQMKEKATTHGESHTRLYRVWQGMRERCNSPAHVSYSLYGARGIKVCPEWDQNYASFKEWAIQEGYDVSAPRGFCTLDRIDVDGDYTPLNCRWVPMSVQNKNRRNNNK